MWSSAGNQPKAIEKRVVCSGRVDYEGLRGKNDLDFLSTCPNVCLFCLRAQLRCLKILVHTRF